MTVDVRNGNILNEYKGHQGPINNFIEVVHQQMAFVLTAGDDSNVHVYNISLASPSNFSVK